MSKIVLVLIMVYLLISLFKIGSEIYEKVMGKVYEIDVPFLKEYKAECLMCRHLTMRANHIKPFHAAFYVTCSPLTLKKIKKDLDRYIGDITIWENGVKKW